MINIQYYKSPVGELIIGAYRKKLCLADWRYRKKRKEIDYRIQSETGSIYIEEDDPVIQKSITELEEYFAGKRQSFDIPLSFYGTEFQLKVWKELLQIPYGKTISYLELARKLGDEKSIRAVASANGANAISIFVPCHRVVGNKNELTGYAGGIEVKRKLLQLENPKRFPEQKRLFLERL